mmetsp:Transcript_43813/g.78812  ORF Transcript_43813/g.78812 Transcript_43813/m.78812 type:complete len:666 (-) Transcript_43813:1023-3020(-)
MGPSATARAQSPSPYNMGPSATARAQSPSPYNMGPSATAQPQSPSPSNMGPSATARPQSPSASNMGPSATARPQNPSPSKPMNGAKASSHPPLYAPQIRHGKQTTEALEVMKLKAKQETERAETAERRVAELEAELKAKAAELEKQQQAASATPQAEAKIILTARHCVVCLRDDRPGQQRKSGFKCNECMGTPSRIHQRGLVFEVAEAKAQSSKDSCGVKHIDAYDLGDALGQGSYGKVKMVKHRISGQMYACKILSKASLQKKKPGSDESPYDKVMSEISIMKDLQHPHVVKLYEVIEDESHGKIFLILEYCPGGCIYELDDQGLGTQDPLLVGKESKLKKYLIAIVHGLLYIHEKGVYHRDLKPDNVLLDANDHCKLADFGVSLSQKAEDSGIIKVEGTPMFMAPELIKGEVESDKSLAAVDVWALGVTVYAMAFGYLPFLASDLDSLNKLILGSEPVYPQSIEGGPVDPRLVDLLQALMQKDPKERLTCQQILEHPYVADIRLVKGYAEEALYTTLAVTTPEDLGISPAQFEGLTSHINPNVDALLLTMPGHQDGPGLQMLSNFVSSHDGRYQVVLPNSTTCTLFRPRSESMSQLQGSGSCCSRKRSDHQLTKQDTDLQLSNLDLHLESVPESGPDDLLSSLNLGLSPPSGSNDLLDSLNLL